MTLNKDDAPCPKCGYHNSKSCYFCTKCSARLSAPLPHTTPSNNFTLGCALTLAAPVGVFAGLFNGTFGWSVFCILFVGLYLFLKSIPPSSGAEGSSAVTVVSPQRRTYKPSSKTAISKTPASDGTVYLIKCGNRYKIGRTKNATRRMRELNHQLPEKPEVVHKIATAKEVEIERYWHRKFAGKRGHGEWFNLTNEDVTEFKRRSKM